MVTPHHSKEYKILTHHLG